ncbi:MAG: glycosyltransferase family 4 protein [Gemmatimonadetes bacterium]|nr:glycosyltransferase family 4 protein [Gemmatimonadota bacterium]
MQIHIRQLTRHLQERGHEVLVLAPGDVPGRHGHVHIVGRTFTTWSNGSTAQISMSPRTMRNLARAMRVRPDVVHVHEPFAPGLGPRRPGRRRPPSSAPFTYYPLRDAEGRVLHRARAATAPHVASRPPAHRGEPAARHSGQGGAWAGDVKILPNGVEVDRSPRLSLRDVPQGASSCSSAGSTLARGPVRDAGFIKLAPRYPDLSLIVVGDGPQRDAVHEIPAELRSRVHMKGKVTYEALSRRTIGPPTSSSPGDGAESFGIVLVEGDGGGAARGRQQHPRLPRRGARRTRVAPGHPSNAEALARGSRTCSTHPEECSSGANGAMRAQAYAWDSIIDDRELVYEKLAGDPASRASAGGGVSGQTPGDDVRAGSDLTGGAAAGASAASQLHSSCTGSAGPPHLPGADPVDEERGDRVGDRVGRVGIDHHAGSRVLTASRGPPELPTTTGRPTACPVAEDRALTPRCEPA